jgi:hypothetical protein
MIVCGWRSKVTFTDNDRNRCTASVGSKHICANPPLDYKPWLSKDLSTRGARAFRDFAVSIVGRNCRRPTPSDKAAKHLVSKPAVPAEFRFDRFAPLLSDIRMIAATRLPQPVCSFAASSVHVSAEQAGAAR